MPKAKKKYSNPRLNSIDNKIERCKQTINQLDSKIAETKQLLLQLKALLAKVSDIEGRYHRNNVLQTLKLNVGFKDAKKEVLKLESKLSRNSLDFLLNQRYAEAKNLLSLNEKFKETEIELQKISILKQIENKLLRKPKIKKVEPTIKIEKASVTKKKQMVITKVARFKSNSGGSSTLLTSTTSIWTVKKR